MDRRVQIQQQCLRVVGVMLLAALLAVVVVGSSDGGCRLWLL